jgi:hypothetical protein
MVATQISARRTSGFSRELQLTLLLARRPVISETAVTVSNLLHDSLDWHRFFALAGIEEVEPVVMTNLIEKFSSMLPSRIRNTVIERQRESKGASLAKTLVLMEVLRLLRANSIDVIVLKGPVVGIYAFGHPALRTFSDLDLLIKPGQLRQVEQLLNGRSYKPLFNQSDRARLLRAGHALEYSDNRVKVELHCSLFPRHLRFDLDESEVWLAASEVNFDGLSIPAPSRAMTFLLACCHAAKHEWSSTRLVSDAAQLLESLTASDAAEVLRLAKKARAVGLVALAVNLVDELFGIEITQFGGSLNRSRRATKGLVDVVIRRMSGQTEAGAHGWINRIDPWLGPLVFWARSRENVLDRGLCLVRPGVQRARRMLFT